MVTGPFNPYLSPGGPGRTQPRTEHELVSRARELEAQAEAILCADPVFRDELEGRMKSWNKGSTRYWRFRQLRELGRERHPDSVACRLLDQADAAYWETVTRWRHCVLKYSRGDDDLLQELLEEAFWAAMRFDPTRNISFGTYLRPWMLRTRQRQDETALAVYRPIRTLTLHRRLMRTIEELKKQGVEPTEELLAELVGKPLSRVKTVLKAVSVGHIDDVSRPLAVEHDFEDCIGARFLDRALDTLEPRERSILETYYGLGTDDPKSMAEIAKGLGVTKSRVQQIKKAALQRIRDEQGIG